MLPPLLSLMALSSMDFILLHKVSSGRTASAPASPTPWSPLLAVFNTVGAPKMPPSAFQFTENCGTLTLPPSPYETEFVETLITGILGFGIVMVIFSKADLTA